MVWSKHPFQTIFHSVPACPSYIYICRTSHPTCLFLLKQASLLCDEVHKANTWQEDRQRGEWGLDQSQSGLNNGLTGKLGPIEVSLWLWHTRPLSPRHFVKKKKNLSDSKLKRIVDVVKVKLGVREAGFHPFSIRQFHLLSSQPLRCQYAAHFIFTNSPVPHECKRDKISCFETSSVASRSRNCPRHHWKLNSWVWHPS